MNTLKAGDKVADFTLLDQNNHPVNLYTCLKNGPVLVYFYPKAQTPGCTVQACGLRDSKAELDVHKVTVLGISPDPSAKLAKFTDKQALNFTLLSDEDHAIADSFGVWGEKKFMGKIYDGIHRLSFLINTDATVGYVFDKFKTKDHHQVVLAQLAKK